MQYLSGLDQHVGPYSYQNNSMFGQTDYRVSRSFQCSSNIASSFAKGQTVGCCLESFVDIYYNFSRLLLTLKSYLYYHYYLLLLLLLQLVEEVSCGHRWWTLNYRGIVVEIAKYSKFIRRQNLPMKCGDKAAVGSTVNTYLFWSLGPFVVRVRSRKFDQFCSRCGWQQQQQLLWLICRDDHQDIWPISPGKESAVSVLHNGERRRTGHVREKGGCLEWSQLR